MKANVLIVGVGGGSWQIRGIQIGEVLGARVTANPKADDWRWADVCILVKRALSTFAADAYAFEVPIVWDALDFWFQPEENTVSVADMVARPRINSDVVIGATQAMADDFGGVYIPHHSRPRLSPAPICDRMQVVAYEGTKKYLGSWHKALETVCTRLGLTFVVNPPDLRHADLVVAFRGEQHDGPICRRWKSGVKYVNALAAGRPILTQPSAAYDELQTPGMVVHDVDGLEAAISYYLPRSVRQGVLNECISRAPEFDRVNIARSYRTVIESALQVAA